MSTAEHPREGRKPIIQRQRKRLTGLELTAALVAYRDSLGNPESRALIADALDALSSGRWRESLLVEAGKAADRALERAVRAACTEAGFTAAELQEIVDENVTLKRLRQAIATAEESSACR